MKIFSLVRDEYYQEIVNLLDLVEVEEKPKDEVYLFYDGESLSLNENNLCLKPDFLNLINRLNHLSSEQIIKVAKIKNKDHLKIVDATAGLGEDSFLLASQNHDVTMIEYNPIIWLLLRDALKRACVTSELKEIASRIKLIKGDSIDYLNNLKDEVDVIYLDPMFPERNKSALIKKKFQLIQKLEAPNNNDQELIEAAIKAKPSKIIIKRPLKAPYLGNYKPSYSNNGKAIRFDCILLTK